MTGSGVVHPLAEPDAVRRAAYSGQGGTGESWLGGWKAVEGFLKRVIADLGRARAIVVEHAEFGAYGSGYASFVEVSITSRDGSRRLAGERNIDVECLPVCLCRLAPVATLHAPDTRSRSVDGRRGSSGLPCQASATTVPVPGWEQESRQIAEVLSRHGIELAPPEVLGLRIDPAVHIETNLAARDTPPYTVFDAWFHWYD